MKWINADHNIFVTKAGLDGLVVSTFVNNIKIITPKNSEIIERIKLELTFAFFIIDISSISFYLGLKVQQDQENRMIKLSQLVYINKIFNKLHLNKAHAVNTPIKETALFKQKTKGEKSPSEKKRYQGMTRSFMFSIVETRPDIAFAMSVTSCFAKNPGHQYTEAVKTILQYLKGSNKQRITYRGQSRLLVERYSNSNWAENKKSRKSTSGFIFMLNGVLVSWCLKK